MRKSGRKSQIQESRERESGTKSQGEEVGGGGGGNVPFCPAPKMSRSKKCLSTGQKWDKAGHFFLGHSQSR